MPLPTTSDSRFAADVLVSAAPVLVDFTAEWCPPCRLISPILAQLATEEAGRFRVLSIDVDDNPVTATHFGITSMPTLCLFIGGQVVTQVLGVKPRTVILAQLAPYLPAPT